MGQIVAFPLTEIIINQSHPEQRQHPGDRLQWCRKGGTLLRVFEKIKAEAALAAGIFHREEVAIEAVKQHMRERGIETR